MFILEHLGAKIRCSCFQGANRLKVQSFTRDRVFTFSLVMFSIINQLSKSRSVELTKFLHTESLFERNVHSNELDLTNSNFQRTYPAFYNTAFALS